MNIEVEKNDIMKIGYKRINFAGVLGIVSDSDTANVEEILLRCILKCFGETYIITKIEDCVMVDEDDLYDDDDYRWCNDIEVNGNKFILNGIATYEKV